MNDEIAAAGPPSWFELYFSFGFETRDLWPPVIRSTAEDEVRLQAAIDAKEFDTAMIAAAFCIPTEYMNL